jgi:hypothetical protein
MLKVESKDHPAAVEVGLRYSRPVGGMTLRGCVVLSFSRAAAYSFASKATWPAENCDGAVREGVEEALGQRLTPSDSVAVVLKSIEWDPVGSSSLGFKQAAFAATQAAFVV